MITRKRKWINTGSSGLPLQYHYCITSNSPCKAPVIPEKAILILFICILLFKRLKFATQQTENKYNVYPKIKINHKEDKGERMAEGIRKKSENICKQFFFP